MLRGDGVANVRDLGLGELRQLPDAAVEEVVSYCDCADLLRVSAASRALYVFAHSDDVWKHLTLFALRKDGKFFYDRSWKQTYINTRWRTAGRDGAAPSHAALAVRDFYSDALYAPYRDAHTPIPERWLRAQTVRKVPAAGLTRERFVAEYESQGIPVVLSGAAESWPAYRLWDAPYLLDRWGGTEFQCEAARLTLKEYLSYAEQQRDDKPLYLFDKHFTETAPGAAAEFAVPEQFRGADADLFRVLGDQRPDRRWLIMGPARSGSRFHKDPNATDAWNACVRGRKRWIFYPPGQPPPGVIPSDDRADVTSPVTLVEWFTSYYHRKNAAGVEPLEVTVGPGEVVYIPSGWWHLCLNLTPTVGITQNYAPRCRLPKVLAFLRDQPHCISGLSGSDGVGQCEDEMREQMYANFRAALRREEPAMLAEAEEAPAEQERRERTGWAAALAADPTDGAAAGGGFAFDF